MSSVFTHVVRAINHPVVFLLAVGAMAGVVVAGEPIGIIATVGAIGLLTPFWFARD